MTTAPRTRSRRTRLGGLVALGLATVLTLSACGSPEEEPPSPEEAAEDVGAAPVEIPVDTPIGERTKWVVDQFNGAEATEQAWEEALHPNFLEEVPAQQFVDVVNEQLRPARPFITTRYEAAGLQSRTTLQSPFSQPIDVQVTIDEQNLIVGLFIGPSLGDGWETAESFSEVEQRLLDLPGDVRAIVQGAPTDAPLLDIASDEAAPLASAFKLYVLLALAQAVEAGELSWDDTVVVTDELKSLPSGELQNEPAGTEVALRDAAAGMIAISDNTATDLVIDRLGREQVEAAVAAAGHHDPESMQPFLTTREAFQLGWGDAEVAERWEGAGVDERRAILDELRSADLDVAVTDVVGEPVWSRGVDWFASARDVAAVHRALHELDDPEVRAILSENPGMPVDDWPYVAFKGGGSIGVLTGSWLVEGEDGDFFTVVLLATADDSAEANELVAQQVEFFGLASETMRLLAER